MSLFVCLNVFFVCVTHLLSQIIKPFVRRSKISIKENWGVIKIVGIFMCVDRMTNDEREFGRFSANSNANKCDDFFLGILLIAMISKPECSFCCGTRIYSISTEPIAHHVINTVFISFFAVSPRLRRFESIRLSQQLAMSSWFRWKKKTTNGIVNTKRLKLITLAVLLNK